MKKVLCIVLSLIIAVSTCIVAFAGIDDGCNCGEDPTIFVTGIASIDIYSDVNGDDLLLPSSFNDILEYVSIGDIIKVLLYLQWGKYDKIADVLIPAAQGILKDTGCNKDGTFPANQGIKWKYPEIREHGKGKEVSFYYDWRKSPCDVADELDAFIDYVCEKTGHSKVKLIGFSLGSSMTLAYLSEYGYDKVSGVVFYAGAYNGVSCCGQPFCLDMDYDSPSLFRYLRDLLGESDVADLVGALLGILHKLGFLDRVGTHLMEMIDKVGDRVYDQCVLDTFVTTPALWALIPVEYYDTAKHQIFDGKESQYAGLIAKIDEYHNIQAKAGEILDGLRERNINFGIVSKYGLQDLCVIADYTVLSDTVVDTKYSSFGATCAPVDGKLSAEQEALTSECGHNHVSPDKLVNAATCRYPDCTWFIRDLPHSNNCDDADQLLYYILYAETPATVYSNPAYPQFMLYHRNNDTMEILSAANVPAVKAIDCDDSLFNLNIKFFKALFKVIGG